VQPGQDPASRHPRAVHGHRRPAQLLPAFLLGFACCVPTFLLVLGAGTAAALLPVLIPLRPAYYPLTLLLLTGTLVWGASRISRQAGRIRRADHQVPGAE
jgi:hypothetical protein